MSLQFEKVLEQVALAGSATGVAAPAAGRVQKNGRQLEELIRARHVMGDRIAICLGLVLSLTAIALPVYVIQTSDGRPSITPVLSFISGEGTVFNRLPVNQEIDLDLDPATTGSVPKDVGSASVQGPHAQASKISDPRFVVQTAAKDLAVVEGPDGMWVVKPGMAIPGAGHVLSIEQSGLGWVVVTSKMVIGQAS